MYSENQTAKIHRVFVSAQKIGKKLTYIGKKKTLALRKNIEKSPIAISIPIYEDSQRDLNLFIKEFFQKNNFSVSNSACLKISSLIGNDKKLIKNKLLIIFLM